jgi:hypothetical protein
MEFGFAKPLAGPALLYADGLASQTPRLQDQQSVRLDLSCNGRLYPQRPLDQPGIHDSLSFVVSLPRIEQLLIYKTDN